MMLTDQESIILNIGELKLSDTFYTFGKRKYVNGILYLPLINPHGEWNWPVGVHLATGDVREGVTISNSKIGEIFFTYGSNWVGSNAQSMAIGYHDKDEIFFVKENFRDIYHENPIVSAREIIRCKYIYESCGIQRGVFSNYDPDYKAKLTKADKVSFERLMAKVRRLKSAFCEENLSKLRNR